jgi:hypothetical protein
LELGFDIWQDKGYSSSAIISVQIIALPSLLSNGYQELVPWR